MANPKQAETKLPWAEQTMAGAQLRYYATHSTPGTRKRPGMTFPGGGTIPTAEDSAWAHALLDSTGVPR